MPIGLQAGEDLFDHLVELLEEAGLDHIYSIFEHGHVREQWIGQLVDARHIDRLNVGPIPTCALNWLQPHEGNIIDFLYRNRAFQNSLPPAH